jgi:GrpB-like predicted nucleotidyltransferase (UPF0157 family)
MNATKNLNEDKVKRELERSRKAMNKMFSRRLSRRARTAKKQRKTAMGPQFKVSVNTSDREDSQTMLNLRDKLAETLLNSFEELLNEAKGSKGTAKKAAASGRYLDKTNWRRIAPPLKPDTEDSDL